MTDTDNTRVTLIIYTGGIGTITFTEGVNGVKEIEVVEEGVVGVEMEDGHPIKGRVFVGLPYEMREERVQE